MYSIMVDTPKPARNSAKNSIKARLEGPARRARRRGLASAAARYTVRTYPIGPQGRLILKIAADKINTPRRRGRR